MDQTRDPTAAPDRSVDLGDTRDTVASGSPSSGSELSRGLPVEVGDVINGKYRVEGVLGEGGVGVVVLAQHLELDERVALKFLKADALSDAGLVARFAREAKAAVSIKSEHVARILDVGTVGPNRVPFIVMEYLDGTDLRTAGQLYGIFSPSDTAEYGLHVCEALAMAHANGIIHRDIKPDNLFLTTNPQMPSLKTVKVLDFGISKAALTGSIFQKDIPLIHTVHLMGTPLYMSPEQVRLTSEADARSDIWSLGMVMYEMLLGTTAFQGASVTELCAAILERAVPPLRDARPEVAVTLAATIERCLEKDPLRRFQNVAELALALMPHAPKRARSCVERSVEVLRASGIAGPGVVFESIAPPPPTNPSLDPGAPPAPTLGSFTLQTEVPGSARGPLPPRPRPRWGQAALVSAIVAMVLVAVSLKLRGASIAAPAGQPSTGASTLPMASAASLATGRVIAAAAEPARPTPPPSPQPADPTPPAPTAAQILAPSIPLPKPAATAHTKPVSAKPIAKGPQPQGARPVEPDLGY